MLIYVSKLRILGCASLSEKDGTGLGKLSRRDNQLYKRTLNTALDFLAWNLNPQSIDF